MVPVKLEIIRLIVVPNLASLFRPARRYPLPTGRQRLLWLLRRMVLIVVMGYLVASVWAAWTVTQGRRMAGIVDPASIASGHEDVAFVSREDHVRLEGWLFHAQVSNGRSVIFVHGWQADRAAAAPLARDMISRGYDALLFDLRGTGTSDPVRSTLGTKEPRDVLGSYDFMIRRHYAAAHMTIIGFDTGAVAVIQAAPLLSDVGALVCDSAYPQLGPILDRGWTAATGLPGGLDVGALAVGRLLGVDPDLSPRLTIRQLPDRAFLFISGETDPFITLDEAAALRAASGSDTSELLVIPAAGHLGAFAAQPAEYLATLYGFIDAQIG